MATTDSPYLYESVADHIRDLMAQGTLQPGDRIPSVRKLHEQRSVSIDTVRAAYQLLEDQGLIMARPQSGYYVKAQVSLPEPRSSMPPPQAHGIDTSIIARIFADMEAPDVVKLGAAIPAPELLPLKALNRLMGQMIRQFPEQVHAYHTPSGNHSLRHEVAKKLINAGCSVPPEDVVITNGTTEAVYLALQAVTQPGDTVAIESPCYYVLLRALEALGLKALEIPTDPRTGMSLTHLEAALKRSEVTACAIVSNFGNPLGNCMSDRRKQLLVDLLNQYKIPLVEDDTCGDLYFTRRRPRAIKAFDTQGHVLYCASVSKTLSPGLKVGWLVAERHLETIKTLKIAMNVTTATAAQLTVSAFFANSGYDRHLRKLRHTYATQLERMRQKISDCFPPQVRMTAPKGGQVLWLEFPEGFDVLQLYEAALDYRISIAPGIIFSPTHSYRNCLRLNFGVLWSDQIDQAIEILGALAQQQLATMLLQKLPSMF